MAEMSWVVESFGNFASQVASLNQVLAELNGHPIVAGLNAIVGDEGSGKTLFLRELCEAHPDALWLDTRLPEYDQTTPKEFWALLKSKHTHWNDGLSKELSLALDLHDHLGKQLYMLSTGSRRKVALISLLASGSQLLVEGDTACRYLSSTTSLVSLLWSQSYAMIRMYRIEPSYL